MLEVNNANTDTCVLADMLTSADINDKSTDKSVRLYFVAYQFNLIPLWEIYTLIVPSPFIRR